MNSFNGKVSIVTGATSGIGRSTAILLAKRGSKVVISGRRESEGAEVVNEIIKDGGDAIFIKTDVQNESEVKNLVDQTISHFGKVDVAFLNAGVFRFNPITDQSNDDLTNQIDVNIKGAYFGLKHVADAFGEKGGSIVFTSSVVADVGFPGATAYSLTKGAINTLTRTAAVELASKNIRVNSVAPGPIWTEGAGVMAGGREGFEAMMAPMVPIGRVGEEIEVAEAAVFLASDAASFITGQVLNVDGGVGIR
jgi:NAD(P)-dependent dehydrogenase (short-subunit alcohol dehydrogenase family)